MGWGVLFSTHQRINLSTPMKKYFTIILTLILTSLSVTAQEDPGYYINKYIVEMDVHADNTYSIKENINVVFTMESHGIFRMIPEWVWVNRDVSADQDGSDTRMMHYKANIRNVNASEEWTLLDDYEEIYAMRFGVYETTYTGPHAYQITYDYSLDPDRIGQADLFFYSVLGSGWDCNVDTFIFNVKFDKPLTDEELAKLQVFAGNEGNNENQAEELVFERTNTNIAGGSSNIGPRQALTLYIPLREGYFTNGLTPSSTVKQFLPDNVASVGNSVSPDAYIAIWLTVITALLLLYIIYKELTGREKVTKIISFYPPKGCSSAEVGTLIDTSVDDQDLISLIPWFAEQGYLTINYKDNAKSPVLNKVKDLPANAPQYQKTLFEGFFSKGGTSFATANAGKSFGARWLKAKEEADKEYGDKLNRINWRQFIVLLAAIMTLSFAHSYACNSSSSWFLGGVTTVVYLIIAIISSVFSSGRKGCTTIFFLTVVSVVPLIFLFGGIWLELIDPDDASLINTDCILIVNGLMIFACILAFNLSYMTPYRRERIGEILGLHEFINTAERQQLQELQDGDEKYFYRILPYAVAFGLADKWAKKFEGLTVPPADWQQGNNIMNDYSCMNANRLFTPSMQSSIKAEHDRQARAAAARSSSGSSHSSSSSFGGGGGGFSGGGFGGGGGGRW